MAALSYSPTPITPTKAAPTQPRINNNNKNSSSSGNSRTSKENLNVNAVKTLGANKPFQKMTVHNVLSESGANALQQHIISNQNLIIRKIKDFGMLGAVHNATSSNSSNLINRKRPLSETKCNSQQQPQPQPLPQQQKTATPSPAAATKRTKLSKKLTNPQSSTPVPVTDKVDLLQQRPVGTPGRKGLPLPQAVARRNARERNRVKQVNNGFAALRERIPEEVSEAFEAQGAGRGASKKLSKVETLRMAVEYIRSLERLLGFDFPPIGGGGGGGGGCSNSNSSSSGDDSFMFIKDEFEGLDDHFDDSLSNYDGLDEPLTTIVPQQQQHQLEVEHEMPTTLEDELLPSVTTLNGLQYVRIPGTSTYQLLTPDMLETSASLEDALIDTNCGGSGSGSGSGNVSGGIAAATAAIAAAAAAAAADECVKFAATLSRSPVPTATSSSSRCTTPTTTATPTTAATATRGSSSLHQPPGDAADAAVAVAVSPVAVAVANQLLLQACAAQQQQQQQQQQLIKQEYTVNNNNNNSGTTSPPASNNNNNNYQQLQQQQQQQQQLLCSPVLPPFYDQDPGASFYDNVVVVGLPSFKKEFTDVLHDQTTTNTAGGCLSDESMIDAIDWWEAHTPKSDAGTVAGI